MATALQQAGRCAEHAGVRARATLDAGMAGCTPARRTCLTTPTAGMRTPTGRPRARAGLTAAMAGSTYRVAARVTTLTAGMAGRTPVGAR